MGIKKFFNRTGQKNFVVSFFFTTFAAIERKMQLANVL